jgi:phage protein D/phage baseplate assembly protein gpV
MLGVGAQLLPDIYVPTFDMTVGGARLDMQTAQKVIEINVTQHLDSPGSFHFRLYDPTLSLVDRQRGKFTEGTRIEISMGFVGKAKKLKKLIVGEITAVATDFPDSGPATLEVQGFDLTHGLMRGTIWRIWGGPGPNDGMADSDIVTQIAKEVSLTPDVDSTGKRSEAVQQNVSNFALLMQLAHLNNYHFWVDDTTLHFKKKRPAPSSLTLEWGKTLMSFAGRLSTAGQVNSVEVRGWDPNQKKQFSATVQRSDTSSLSSTGQEQLSKGAGGQSNLLITDATVTNAQQAKDYAQAIMTSLQTSLLTGSGTAVGDPDMQVGTTLKLGRIGRFDGTYTVQQVSHTIGAGGYQTSFEVLQKDASTSDLFSKATERGSDLRYGVVPAVVIHNNDSTHLGKVQIRLPHMTDDSKGPWARVVALMGGGDRGTFFLPEEGDEVLVAFENGDPNKPYILGGLWSNKDKPPDTNADGKNNKRLIKSRSGHLIRLDDTDGSEKVEIIDKSGNNSVTFDTSKNTITITSAQDVNINATQGTITLSAKTISISSSADTTIAAKSGLTLQADGSTTTIKGQTVNIN